ncbi:MAG: DUF1992 domain-containing protein [Pseudomonadota bacterium]
MVDFSKLAEQRLQEAVARGELDDLPGKGQRLPDDPDTALPPELRMAYKILKNHGLVPREVELLRQIDEARQRVEGASDPPARLRELKQLEALCLDYNLLRQRPAELEQSALSRDPDKR